MATNNPSCDTAPGVLEKVAAIAAEWKDRPDMLLQVLHRVQEVAGNGINEDILKIVSQEMRTPLSRLYEVLTFYSFFSTEKRGKVIIRLCKTAPCRVKGAKEVLESFEEELGIKVGETTPDGQFTLETSECIGACNVSPAALIGSTLYGDLTPEKVSSLISSLRSKV